MELSTDTNTSYCTLSINGKQQKMTTNLAQTFFHAIMKFSPQISNIKYNNVEYDIDNHSDRSLLTISQEDALDIEYYFDESLEIDNEYLDDCIIDEYYGERSDKFKKSVYDIIMNMLNNLDLNTSFDIGSCDQIMFKNIRGINYDKRGTRDNILLPYHEKYTIDCPFTLDEFLTGYHKIKSHKFDYWYELYGKCKLKFEKINDLETLVIECDFDHGS
jgi:hypothetical protein